jgi:hypothetical protein
VRRDIAITLAGLGQVYEKEITESLIQIWCALLGELTEEELNAAVKAYCLDPELSRFMPKPGQIFGLARPQIDREEEAAIVADSIFAAQRLYGADSVGTSRAQLKIGALGWEYIQAQGGWQVFWHSVTSTDEVPILKSQVRKALMGLIHRQRSGMATSRPALEEVSLKSLGVELKTLV